MSIPKAAFAWILLSAGVSARFTILISARLTSAVPTRRAIAVLVFPDVVAVLRPRYSSASNAAH